MRVAFRAWVGLFCLAMGSLAHAGVIRNDVPDASYLAVGNDPKYAAVGSITFGTNYDWGSGTLVAGRWVLTAAHLVRSNFFANTPGNVRFNVGGNTYFGDQIFLHPGYVQNLPTNGNDLALIRLSSAVQNVDPIGLYTGSSEIGQTGTFVGFGRTGNGLTGQTGGGPTKRGGTNDIDITGDLFATGWSSNVLLSDFDSPTNPAESSFGSSTPTALEYLPSDKDSGSGVFVDVLGTPRLAGVVSFALFDGDGINYSYGDGIAYVRVSGQLPWITSVVPEASSFVLLAFGGAVGAVGWMIRKSYRPVFAQR